MHIILGGTGHIGSALTRTLLEQGEAVTIISRDSSKAQDLQRLGAQVAEVDVHEVEALRDVFRQGRRLFLLNPPAAPSTDTDVEERKSVASILAALDGSGLEKIVAQSAYGAQPGEHLADLGVLYEMEQALAAQPIPTTILRAAYFMSNWASAVPSAREQGVVPTLFPPDFELPMVAHQDIGHVAARLMLEPAERTGLHFVEGPARYRAQDVADALAQALHKPVQAIQTPQEQWPQALQSLGFSENAAASFAHMTAVTLHSSFPDPSAVEKGKTSLQEYVTALVRSDEGA